MHAYIPGHNILLDFREATGPLYTMSELLQLAMYMAHHESYYDCRIVAVVPEAVVEMSQQFRACMKLEGLSYELFTHFEHAIDWLADIFQGETP